MVKKQIFPGACYGLDRSEKDGVLAHDYRVIYAGPGFPSEAEMALEQMARGVEWRSDSEAESYPPCFALWPTERGVLAIRIRDSGRDDQERPHALRIEAAYIEERAGQDNPDRLAGLLDDSAWPPGGWNRTESLEIETRSEKQNKTRLIQSIKNFIILTNRLPRLLLTGIHLKYDVQDYDEVFSVDGGVTIPIRSRREGTVVMSNSNTQLPPTYKGPEVDSSSRRRAPRQVILLTGSCMFIPLAIAVWWIWVLRSENGRLESENRGLTSKVESVEIALKSKSIETDNVVSRLKKESERLLLGIEKSQQDFRQLKNTKSKDEIDVARLESEKKRQEDRAKRSEDLLEKIQKLISDNLRRPSEGREDRPD
jgi:hypothetical protein